MGMLQLLLSNYFLN